MALSHVDQGLYLAILEHGVRQVPNGAIVEVPVRTLVRTVDNDGSEWHSDEQRVRYIVETALPRDGLIEVLHGRPGVYRLVVQAWRRAA